MYLYKIFFLLICIIEPSLAFSFETYTPPIDVNLHYWNECTPYFLPVDHPIKSDLDSLFSQRITKDLKSLKAAGFKCKKQRNWNNIIVATHPHFDRYIFKIYLDDQLGICEVGNWLERVKGAILVKKIIRKYHYQKKFNVPKKWIYPLPEDQDPCVGGTKKFFILIAEEMDLLGHLYNDHFWKHPLLSYSLLKGLYRILSEAGLIDSVYIDNIPICIDGRVAFVDTEHSQKWPVPFHKLSYFLFKEQKEYWEMLIEQDK